MSRYYLGKGNRAIGDAEHFSVREIIGPKAGERLQDLFKLSSHNDESACVPKVQSSTESVCLHSNAHFD